MVTKYLLFVCVIVILVVMVIPLILRLMESDSPVMIIEIDNHKCSIYKNEEGIELRTYSFFKIIKKSKIFDENDDEYNKLQNFIELSEIFIM